MALFSKGSRDIVSQEGPLRTETLWIKCESCGEILYKPELERALNVCPNCNFHFYMGSNERIKLLIDKGSWEELFSEISPCDPLGFKDSKRYSDRLKALQTKLGVKEAIVTGEGTIDGLPVLLGVFDFRFMGGSMGSVVGEKITLLFEKGAREHKSVIIVSSSGGARMQEGIISLMQMSKCNCALSRLREKGVLFLSILTNPTTGGVAASFATLGDINIAEPKALIGFAGPRVIEQTIQQKLPEGFQRAEYLLEHGMVDMIVERKNLKETIIKILRIMCTPSF